MRIAGTGHRPPRLSLGYDESSRRLLREFILTELKKILVVGPITSIVSGMAQGFDQALAEAAQDLGIYLIAAVPFEGQESKWPPAAQRKYRDILALADEIVTVCPGSYAAWKFTKRDHWLVDNCDALLALLDDKPEKSGTRLTVQYAERQGIPVTHLWPAWDSRVFPC